MRDESEFVWAIDGNGYQVRVPRAHLEVFAGVLTEIVPDAPAEPTTTKTPAKPDNTKEK